MKRRLLGVELCRGLSTYAVILVHSGDETWKLPIDSTAITFRALFYFAVPFFLAAAFYFMTAKPENGESLSFWRSRLDRLVVPYIIWSAIFLLARIVVFTLSKKLDRLQQLIYDPLAIAFLGGASYHLYFLPLLLAGTLLMLLAPLLKKLHVNRHVLVFLSIISLFLYYCLESSGNGFQLGTNIAFQSLLDLWNLSPKQYPVLRLALVELAWIIRCLPYFFIALTLNHFLPKDNIDKKLPSGLLATAGWAIAFVSVNALGKSFLPGIVQEILVAYTLLILGFALSNYIDKSNLVDISISVGACSFGIYLLHPFAMSVVKPVIGRAFPAASISVSIPSMLLLSIPCFLLSWLIVICLCRSKLLAKYLLGA